MADIFISYDSADKGRVRLLVEVLEDQGWTVWWDRRIPPGKTFAAVIYEALQQAKCIIVIWSAASIESKWVRKEAAEGERRGILVPVLFDEVQIPFEFRDIHAAALAGYPESARDAELRELVAAIADYAREPGRKSETEEAISNTRTSAAGAGQEEPVMQVEPPSRVPTETERKEELPPETEPPTLVVDALRRGDHPTLTAALATAKPGDRILVRPGLYREGVVIDKPVEIIGDGELGDVVIEANQKDAVLFSAKMGRIANLTLRQVGGGEWYCVDIAQGRLELEGCDITSQSLACVAIHGGADPQLIRNRIHDGKAVGVFVYENGQGTLEDNEIFGNAAAGVEIKEGGNPTLRRNRIHDGKQGGVFVYENGQGTLEDNEIFGNENAGVAIMEGGNPTLRRNRIHDGKEVGVFVYENGQGILEDNEIFGNASAGVEIKEGGNPTLRRNRISKNGFEAIWVYDGGQGVFEDNDLRGNVRGAWDVSPDCEDKVKRTRNQE